MITSDIQSDKMFVWVVVGSKFHIYRGKRQPVATVAKVYAYHYLYPAQDIYTPALGVIL